MSRKSEIIRSENIVLHVYNRGVDRQTIYFRPTDYDHFLCKMGECIPRGDLSLLAYCLLPNHFHMAIHQRCAFAVSEFVQRLCAGYVHAVNRSRVRSGHLFEGRFKVSVVRSDLALLELTRYIHLNPVTAGLAGDPAAWTYSSFREFAGGEPSKFLEPESVLRAAGGREGYLAFVRHGNGSERVSSVR